jgi:hypothetical protein
MAGVKRLAMMLERWMLDCYRRWAGKQIIGIEEVLA